MKHGLISVAAALLVYVFGGAAYAQAPSNQALLNPDVATEQQLLGVPHMTPAIVKTLVGKRPFKTMIEVNAILSASLTRDQLTQVYGRLFKPLNLNTAAEAEILLIPGVGARMAHEFEEYRPYQNIAQFRREIGKYVNEQEVARLERYVTLN